MPRASATHPSPLLDSLVYPWSTIFKLLVRFHVGSTDYYYVCSAFAAGPFHLVTAGHCVFNWDPNGDGQTNDRKWADEIWAWAAQTDQISPSGVPDRPYGQAKMVYMRSYDGWMQLEQFDNDWGVITLDRRDGDHTGWMGRDTATASSVHFSGYPVQLPYVPSGTLVQYSGFDVGNVLGYSCCRINLNAFIYGGHSGGPSWRVDDATGDAFVEGIHSTSNRSGSATDTYLNAQKRADLLSFQSDDETTRPPVAEADLTEYQFDTAPRICSLLRFRRGAPSRSSTTSSTRGSPIRARSRSTSICPTTTASAPTTPRSGAGCSPVSAPSRSPTRRRR